MPLNIFDNIDRTFFTVIVIISFTALLYRFVGRFNKPIVLGGLFAGVIIANLNLPPQYFDLNSCSALGDMGISLFMMLLGAKFELAKLQKPSATALMAGCGLLLPFVAAIMVAAKIYPLNAAAPSHISLFHFAILLGLAMATSAFSLVSMFLHHSFLMRHKVAQVALLVSGVDDFLFWIIFGGILIYYQTNAIFKLGETLGLTLYLLALVFVFPRLIKWMVLRISKVSSMLGFLVVGCFTSAVIADAVDLHQVFGAFVFGLLLPRDNQLIKQVCKPLQNFVDMILLPIFFAKIGASANINIFADSQILWVGLWIAVVAFCSKFLAIYWSGRLLGYSLVECKFMASILNMRGVVEVVMLKVAWEVGLITLSVFTTLIIMSVITGWLATSGALVFGRSMTKLSLV
jgi:Kef-type K+ transport system membrane component KefB